MKATHIVVIQSGWVFVGTMTKGDSMVTLTDAACVRRWGTTMGLGQLALSGPTKETVLEPSGIVQVPLHAVHFFIPVGPKAWAH
jgi:hypothetical protein